ncbi:T9SS type A sorting domain-containing protein [Chitinophaga rhizophila]|uniref:T9SS type A sorting domain-containing protein n=1 Tax=Chitinophaga rhizophila TaxID=2866212 RepID=A0ABS7GGM2_9BACT|nr:T9SS type A sorting domain-containing protein [Chitinophaga rhizophila]MBW8686838.1 T9SS type A sorting domain-containing protein [Chitinophaga rhizophila]
MKLISKLLTVNAVGASFLFTGMAHAQRSLDFTIERQVVASAGGGVTQTIADVGGKENLYEIDCTIGDIAVKTWTYPDYIILSQGFQQGPLVLDGRTNSDDMIVFPNPTDEQITIRYTLDSNVTRVDVRVLNLSGRMVFSESNTPRSALSMSYVYTLNVSDYVPGIYFVTIIFDTGIKVTRKFIKFDK